MKKIFDQRFFRLLSECSQRKVSASEFAEAIEELATHVANFSINEQDYNVLLRYFSFGLHRLKSYRVRFEQEKKTNQTCLLSSLVSRNPQSYLRSPYLYHEKLCNPL